MSVRRIYVEKKPAFAVEAQQLLHEIRHILLIKSVCQRVCLDDCKNQSKISRNPFQFSFSKLPCLCIRAQNRNNII